MTTSSPSPAAPPFHVYVLPWTKEWAIETLAFVIRDRGRRPTRYELARLGCASSTTLRKLFGSLSAAMERAEARARELA